MEWGCCINVRGGFKKCLLSGYRGKIMVNPKLEEVKLVVVVKKKTFFWTSISQISGSSEEAVREKLTH